MIIKIPDKLIPLFNTDYSRYIIDGGRSSGKSWTAALFVLNCAMLGYFCQCSREVASAIDTSSKKLLDDTIVRSGYENSFHSTDKEITCPKSGGRIIFKGLKGGSKSETKTRLRSTEGVDLLWIEEAQAVTLDTLIDINPTVRGITADGKKRKIIYTLNPYAMPDPVFSFYDSQPDVLKLTCNICDNPFAPIDQVEKSEAMRINDPVLWEHVYGGKPMSQGEQCIISLAQFNSTIERPWDGSRKELVAADIARFGDDSTFAVKRRGNAIIDVLQRKKSDLITTADELMRFAKGSPLRIDETGLGAGVVDYCKRRGYPCRGINFASAPMDKKKYKDLPTEMWFTLADKMDKISLPNDSDLRYQLTTRQYTYDSYHRIKIEDKATYKKRAGKSPDMADAVIMAFYDINTKKIHFYK